MAEYIDIDQLWKCDTCFHHQGGSCSPRIWCENGESYRPDYRKLKKADVAPVVHGRWIERKSLHAEGGVSAKCSVCQKAVQYLGNPLKCCPHCGARMDGA